MDSWTIINLPDSNLRVPRSHLLSTLLSGVVFPTKYLAFNTSLSSEVHHWPWGKGSPLIMGTSSTAFLFQALAIQHAELAASTRKCRALTIEDAGHRWAPSIASQGSTALVALTLSPASFASQQHQLQHNTIAGNAIHTVVWGHH